MKTTILFTDGRVAEVEGVRPSIVTEGDYSLLLVQADGTPLGDEFDLEQVARVTFTNKGRTRTMFRQEEAL